MFLYYFKKKFIFKIFVIMFGGLKWILYVCEGNQNRNIMQNLQEVIEKHLKWIKGKEGGVRANLSGADLFRANLSGANLSVADLSGANLSGANLSGANLSGADLFRADLSRANLSVADLSGANLSVADLFRADLSRADLSGANLSGANLSGADLSGANLSVADLFRADLSRADLSGANLSGANLSGAVKVTFHCKWRHGITDGNLIHIGCEKRSVEAWKKFIDSDEVIETKRDTEEFKQIVRVIKGYIAYLGD